MSGLQIVCRWEWLAGAGVTKETENLALHCVRGDHWIDTRWFSRLYHLPESSMWQLRRLRAVSETVDSGCQGPGGVVWTYYLPNDRVHCGLSDLHRGRELRERDAECHFSSIPSRDVCRGRVRSLLGLLLSSSLCELHLNS